MLRYPAQNTHITQQSTAQVQSIRRRYKKVEESGLKHTRSRGGLDRRIVTADDDVKKPKSCARPAWIWKKNPPRSVLISPSEHAIYRNQATFEFR